MSELRKMFYKKKLGVKHLAISLIMFFINQKYFQFDKDF